MKKNSKYLIILFVVLFFSSSSLLIINYSEKARLQKDIDQIYINAINDSMSGLSKSYDKLDENQRIIRHNEILTNLKDALEVFHLTSYQEEDEIFLVLNELYIKLLINQHDNNYFVENSGYLYGLLGEILFFPNNNQDEDLNSFLGGSTLPGATDINPAVMYNGNIYYWESMAGPSYKLPQGSLPKGYENVGDIIYSSSENLTEELQFTATFDATGQLYYNKDNPDNVYISITTYWLENAYVKFSKK